MEMVCLRCGWLVNPPLLDSRFIEIVGWVWAGLLRWFVCRVVGWCLLVALGAGYK